MATLGTNLVATVTAPGPAADQAAGAVGVAYLAFLTTDEIPGFAGDSAKVSEARAERHLAGFQYFDPNVVEGFITPETQQRAYTTLKSLFPDKLVVYPTRLDPIIWNPGFLDSYFRPDSTDLVIPYFYPVGTTPLGEAREDDPWQDRLATLLAVLAPRVPAGKGVFPVLQAFEQQGYPVSTRFPAAQLAVYRSVWPGIADVAIEGWQLPEPVGPLVELAKLPALQTGVCSLLAGMAGPHTRCQLRRTLPWR